MNNKKGQDFSITTLILVILGVAVLVILIIGFTQGWDKFGTWFGTKNNQEDISNQCNIACSSAQAGSIGGWCTVLRTVKDGTNTFTGRTCSSMTSAYTVPGSNPAKTLAAFVSACSSVTCP